MAERSLTIGYDVGTGGSKAVLATMDGQVLAEDFQPYEVCYPAAHCAEQEPDDWWRAVTANARRLLEKSGRDAAEVSGIAFSTQMLGVVPMAAEGTPLSRGIIWMDCRAERQAARLVRRFGGRRVLMALVGAVPSGKDVMCKIKWIQECEPEVFERTSAFLDVKGYLLYRATGKFVTDQTAASVTGVMDKKTRDYSGLMMRLMGVPADKMPPVLSSIDTAGELTEQAAVDMGLEPGTPVVAGMGDAPAGPVGAGTLEHGECVVSIGTSGLLMVTVRDPVNLGKYGIASIAAASPDMWLLVGETNTAGGCLKWFSEQLASGDEKQRASDEGVDLYKVLDSDVLEVPPGSNGLVFAPWMYGERAPVTDTTLRGGFFNLSIDHGRLDMLRAVYEGVAMNFRWMFEAVAGKGLPCEVVRAIGGGATADPWMQIFADVTGRRVEAVESAEVAGALGAALCVPVALGVYGDYQDIKDVVRVRKSFDPDAGTAALYGRLFHEFKELYRGVSPVCRRLNKGE